MTAPDDTTAAVLDSVWKAGHDHYGLDEDCSPTKPCRNMRGVSFDGYADSFDTHLVNALHYRAPRVLARLLDVPAEDTFHFPGGLKDYLKATLGSEFQVTREIFAGTNDPICARIGSSAVCRR